jgi:thiamine transport system substrate-binding protein
MALPKVLLAIGLVAVLLGFFIHFNRNGANDSQNEAQKNVAKSESKTLRVLAYSSFISSWGPGPTLVRMFEHEYSRSHPGQSVKVELLQAEDAGLLLAKMKILSSDVVIGFDQFSRPLAKKETRWKKHLVNEPRYSDEEFLAFDWAPIGFVYREGEIDPPKSLADLLHPRFKGKIALQDPRSSSPGFQFLSWVASEMPGEKSVDYLHKLKTNVHSVSGSWSQSYGMFTRGLATLVLSYATSPLYHRFSEKDDRYRFAVFKSPHPVQVEFVAIPEACEQCDLAHLFLKFLNGPPAQAVIMNKNWMLPVNEVSARGTPFEAILSAVTDPQSSLKVRPLNSNPPDDSDRDQLLRAWQGAKF